MTKRTYYDSTTGKYLGSYDGPDAGNPFFGHDSVEGQFDGFTKLVGGVAVPDLDEVTAVSDRDAKSSIDLKVLKALVIWLAPLVGKTPSQARDEIIAVFKGL